MIRFDTDTTRGLLGCAEAEMGVSSWPWVRSQVPSRTETSVSQCRKGWFRCGCRWATTAPPPRYRWHQSCRICWKCWLECSSWCRIASLAHLNRLCTRTKTLGLLSPCSVLVVDTTLGYSDLGSDTWSMGAPPRGALRFPSLYYNQDSSFWYPNKSNNFVETMKNYLIKRSFGSYARRSLLTLFFCLAQINWIKIIIKYEQLICMLRAHSYLIYCIVRIFDIQSTSRILKRVWSPFSEKANLFCNSQNRTPSIISCLWCFWNWHQSMFCG